jgi:hypothetical protein
MTSLDQSAKKPAVPSDTSAGVLTNPTRLRLIAQCWIVIAFAAYLIDLLRQTHDGLSDGIVAHLATISSTTGQAHFSRFMAAPPKSMTSSLFIDLSSRSPARISTLITTPIHQFSCC